ncbi:MULTISPECIES: hypothetical protein [Leptospira]|nr:MULTISPECIES: hypothetical protein [Leptospira]EMO95057.1 hypothetical protein LEP1GSC109_0825 [Leptospira interrogans str. UI 13372]OQM30774.1 hypothetical protein DV38_09255 [Leptospira interrogans]UML78837.1 hypothetical protein FH602_01715 [Leptospira kirschneri]
MKFEFNNLPWHDAELLLIEINRTLPGHNDSISILVKWPDELKSRITFTNCYGFEARMNFGFIAEESILRASINNEQEKLYIIKENWKSMGVDLDNLKCYEIETNTTGSLLLIYAIDFQINPEPRKD